MAVQIVLRACPGLGSCVDVATLTGWRMLLVFGACLALSYLGGILDGAS